MTIKDVIQKYNKQYDDILFPMYDLDYEDMDLIVFYEKLPEVKELSKYKDEENFVDVKEVFEVIHTKPEREEFKKTKLIKINDHYADNKLVKQITKELDKNDISNLEYDISDILKQESEFAGRYL